MCIEILLIYLLPFQICAIVQCALLSIFHMFSKALHVVLCISLLLFCLYHFYYLVYYLLLIMWASIDLNTIVSINYSIYLIHVHLFSILWFLVSTISIYISFFLCIFISVAFAIFIIILEDILSNLYFPSITFAFIFEHLLEFLVCLILFIL